MEIGFDGRAGEASGGYCARFLTWGLILLVLVACTAQPSEVAVTPSPPAPSPEATSIPLLPAPSPTQGPAPTLAAVEEPAAAPEDVLPTAEVTATMAPTAEPEPDPPQPVEHRVQAGEALLGLALDYGVPMAAIQLENEMGEGISLWAGQVLTIPAAAEWEGASPYWLLHQVKAGETLSGIAATYGVELDKVWSVNGLTTDLLAIDQLLIVPLEVPVEAFMRAPAPPASEEGAASGEAGPAEPVTLPPAAPLPADIAAWPAALFERINQARAAHGLYPLAYNETLAWAAQLHAQDCAQRGWCSHTGSDGSGSNTRILRTGYPAAGTAECWVNAATPEKAFEFWYYETPPYDPHRRTLLGTYLTEVGIGIVSADWGYYFVADFGRP
jgi:uncharacterized protein YkwD